MNKLENNSLQNLIHYCEAEQFKGWDPYDGLNSKIFQSLPLKKNSLMRLIMIQSFKRNPLNLRKLFLVPKQYNAKGLGLFLTSYCNLYKVEKREEYYEKITFLADKLLEIRSEGYSGDCWGYNFDWQARRLFLFPKNTPTVVATCFVAYSLFDAYEITKDKKYLNSALSAVDFVVKDLNRTPKKRGFLFSYSPLNGNNTVFNASLLGSKLLARAYSYSKDEKIIALAKESVQACVDAQQEDGSWLYGELPVQNWIDSFHTGYNLEAIYEYQKYSGDYSYQNAIEKGVEYYLNNFFEEDGTPKYYHNKTYPIDIHSPAQFIVTLSRMNIFKENEELAGKVLNWTIHNMQSKKGFFYYQLKKGISSKIPYMRWSQAWMMYALTFYKLSKSYASNSSK